MFEQCPLEMTYVGDYIEEPYTIVVERVLLERSATLVYGRNVEAGEVRPFRLDHVTTARARPPA